MSAPSHPITAGAHRSVDPTPDLDALAEASRRLEGAPATEVVEWAWERFGRTMVLAASFQDCVMIDLVQHAAPATEIAFLDTGYHFAETLWYVEQVRRRYGLDLTVVRADLPADDRWLTDPDGCCAARKVEPLAHVLEGHTAWMSGVRRADAPSRATTPVVTYDLGRGLVKVNPIATWTDDEVERYQVEHDLPRHPLADRGYASIGCWPCTRPVTDTDDPRSGRWAGSTKTECGLHR
ncbi:MAG: phosphoadenylyl-sulfate reductase [Deltaproteobacteria bacterium]